MVFLEPFVEVQCSSIIRCPCYYERLCVFGKYVVVP